MIYPTINELTRGGHYNRYELVVATAKCARLVTDEYVNQRAAAEHYLSNNKDTDRTIASMIKREYRDEKAVKTAIKRLHHGEYRIIEAEEAAARAAARAEAEAAAAEAAADAAEADLHGEDAPVSGADADEA